MRNKELLAQRYGCEFFFVLFFVPLGIEPRALYLLGKQSMSPRFLFGKIKVFWRWMMVMADKLREYY